MYTSAFGAGDANRPIPLVLENNAVIQFYNQNGSSYAGNALPGPQYPIQLAGMYHAA